MSEETECTPCQANAILKNPDSTDEERAKAQAVLDAEAEKTANVKLTDLYMKAVNTQSDINEHCDKLRELASQCEHVTDIGQRYGVSSVALYAGMSQTFVQVIPHKVAPHALFAAGGYAHLREGRDVRIQTGVTPHVDIEETDLLFLDTAHTASRIKAELEKYAPLVRRYIVRHDTQIYGETGEGGGPGLLIGIREYLREHPEWSVVYDTQKQYGLMVLSRDDRDKPKLPNAATLAFNFARHKFNQIAHGDAHVSEEVYNKRLDACMLCIHRVANRCSECGCYLDHNDVTGGPGKAALKSGTCPDPEGSRWPNE